MVETATILAVGIVRRNFHPEVEEISAVETQAIGPRNCPVMRGATGSTILHIAAELHIGTGLRQTGLVVPLAVIHFPDVRPAPVNR